MLNQPTTETRGWSNRPLVRETDRLRSRRLWLTLLAFALALAPAGAFVLEQNACLTLIYAVEALRSESERLHEEERGLRVERAELESLGEIELWAGRERGMRRPAPEEVVIVAPRTTGPARLVAGRPVARTGS